MMFKDFIHTISISEEIKSIAANILDNKRISANQAIALYEQADLSLLGFLANEARKHKVGNYVFYNRNVHIFVFTIVNFVPTLTIRQRNLGNLASPKW